jgi:hypothetical protein
VVPRLNGIGRILTTRAWGTSDDIKDLTSGFSGSSIEAASMSMGIATRAKKRRQCVSNFSDGGQSEVEGDKPL